MVKSNDALAKAGKNALLDISIQMTEQGMDKIENDVSEVIHGLTPVDPKAFEDFKREMTDEVLPEIIRVMEERRVLAAESGQRQIKCTFNK